MFNYQEELRIMFLICFAAAAFGHMSWFVVICMISTCAAMAIEKDEK